MRRCDFSKTSWSISRRKIGTQVSRLLAYEASIHSALLLNIY